MQYNFELNETSKLAKIAEMAQNVHDTYELAPAIAEFASRNNFLYSLFQQINDGKILSKNQILSSKTVLERFVVRQLENQQEVTATFVKKNVTSDMVQVGDILTVNHVMAVKIGLQAGFAKKFHNIEVLELIDAGFGSVTVKAVTCYKKVCHCGVCGLKLTDPESIALGIGPVCAKGRQIKRVEDLDQALGKAEITIRIPKQMIKNVFRPSKEIITPKVEVAA